MKKIVVKKAQSGTGMTPARAALVAKANANRADIARKKDSIIQRNANAKGMSKDYFNSWANKNDKKPDADRYSGSLMDGSASASDSKGGPAKAPCKGGKCAKSGDTQYKNGGRIKKKS